MLFWHRDLDCNRQVISNDVHDERIKNTGGVHIMSALWRT